LCKTAGIRSTLRPYPATFLGTSEVTLTELALAYTIFPNAGWRPAAPHILEKIEEKDGTVWIAQRETKNQAVIKPETAYEVHSCLVDALENGTGKTARTEYGLKKFPAAGKTGTAYDFTDALFAGYDSKLTCAVWAGFDKPQKIYRGAFGRELAMPVWVDIMNAEAEHSPPQEIQRPAGLKDVEICSRSGLLATDKCYDTVKSLTGDTVRKRTTYMEIATAAQMPTEPCNVHGEPRARIVADTQAAEPEAPRAEPAANLSDVQPIALKGPVLIAQNDPYNSVRAAAKVETVNADEASNVAGKTDKDDTQTERTDTRDPIIQNAKREAQKPVLRAVPVEPTPEETPVEIRRAAPVGPMDEVDQGALLKAVTPSPGESDQ